MKRQNNEGSETEEEKDDDNDQEEETCFSKVCCLSTFFIPKDAVAAAVDAEILTGMMNKQWFALQPFRCPPAVETVETIDETNFESH